MARRSRRSSEYATPSNSSPLTGWNAPTAGCFRSASANWISKRTMSRTEWMMSTRLRVALFTSVSTKMTGGARWSTSPKSLCIE